MVTPFWLELSSALITRRAAPLGAVLGMRMFSWYNPVWPGASPANITVACCPAMVAETGKTVVESVSEGGGVPAETDGATAPRPVQKTATILPRAAGTCDAMMEPSPLDEPSSLMILAWPFPRES